ncbi:hypothetical protein CH282_15955 [Rhodococcus sp. 06-418-1B]|nr:DUF6349 family protein [Rhodococcus sp. 06-418-1B]OZC83443.1 hypothetical protein CH282_15955 [Rhodococcus sp. 06-418-1B]
MNIPGQLDIFDALADLEADENDRHERLHGIPVLFASTVRGIEARTAEFDAWTKRWGHFRSICDSHAWVVQATAPSERTETCQPTVLTADLRCTCDRHRSDTPCLCVGALVYRGGCTGCTWESGDVGGENDAVNAALDHAHPGWLEDLDNAVAPAAWDKTAAWERKTRNKIGERPDGWPVITTRTAPGLRSVPGRSPWGGYDIAHSVAQAHRDAQTVQHAPSPVSIDIHAPGKAHS